MKFVFWPRFEKDILAFTTTREDGFSIGTYSGLNLAYHVGDDHDRVQRNRHLLFDHFKMTKENTVIVHQFHSDIALEAKSEDAGRGFESFDSGLEADALFTEEKGLSLGIYHADCVPVFIYVPSVKVVAIIHAGEAGSLANITGKTVAKIIKKYKVSGQEIYAFLGPTLKFGHRIISQSYAEDILKQHPDYTYAVKGNGPEYFLDLMFLNFMSLRNLGVPSLNIDIYDDCTFENDHDFFSYAREKKTGRMMSFISIK